MGRTFHQARGQAAQGGAGRLKRDVLDVEVEGSVRACGVQDGFSPDFSPTGVERGRVLCDKCCAINQLPHDRSAAS